ncbi:hypothetical protein [Spirosoma sp. 209]|uniref:hypothetical protein n=1 Tax=Spirosoma sp. 209 TaxID=1955701 RepID=UPI001116C326|nr:hypothetical protein [Spirosoma sp. 209]
MKLSQLLCLSLLSGVLFQCSSSTSQEETTALKPSIQLASPTGDQLATSMEELQRKIKPEVEKRYGLGTTIKVTKITYGIDSPDDRLLIKRGSLAMIHYTTASGQEDKTIGATSNLEMVVKPGTKLAKVVQEYERRMRDLQDPAKEL